MNHPTTMTPKQSEEGSLPFFGDIHEAEQSKGQPENINMGNWRQLVRDVVDEHPGVFLPNYNPNDMSAEQSPPTTLSEERFEAIDYSQPTPESDSFINRIDDSETDLGQIQAFVKDLEIERNHFRARLQTAKQQLGQVREEVRGLREAAENGAMCLEAISYVYQIGEAGNDAKTIRKQLAALSATPSDGCGKGRTDGIQCPRCGGTGEEIISSIGPVSRTCCACHGAGVLRSPVAASSIGKEGGE